MSSDTDSGRWPGSLPSRPKILAFHKLTRGLSFSVSNFTPSRFERLLRFLRDKGYQFGAVEEVITDGNPLRVAITFDDGYAHVAGVLPRLMQRYDFRPLLLIPTAFIGQVNKWDYTHMFRRSLHLNVAEIRQLASLGVQFGSHGHRHVALTRCGETALSSELHESRQILEEVTACPVTIISYPFGRFNDCVVQAAVHAGYRLGLTTRVPSRDDTPMTMGRLPIYGFDSQIAVLSKVEGGPLARLENLKVRITSALSVGTDILNRLRRM